MTVSFIRTIFFYAVLILFLRIMGKRQLGELQPSEFAVTLLLANLAAIPMQAPSIPLISGLIPIMALLALEMIISFLLLKSRRLRLLISGKPVVIIENGRINRQTMKKLRINIDDLCEELRLAGVADIEDIGRCVVEPNGQLSISDRGAPVLRPLICDGKPDKSALRDLGITDENLLSILKTKGYKSPSEVFLMCIGRDGKIFTEGKEEC